ncbi:MAG: peptide deformylase [Minwuiales bacterium]|nr:peptide deformylase [Minwuiales bacterium]
MGHTVLSKVAAPVDDPRGEDVARLVEDMLETLDDIGGLGLAAPQVHVSKRVVIFHLPAARTLAEDGEAGAVEMTVLINPVIEPLSEDKNSGWEGCLSVPGLRGLVPRYSHIRYTGVGLDGEPIDREARDFHARVLQHECDHLDGVLYPQRMTDMKWLVFESELKHVMAAAADEREAVEA